MSRFLYYLSLSPCLNNFSTFNGFKYPMPKTINTASSHLLVLLQPLFSFGLHLCKCLLPNFKILRFPDRIHINRLIHLLLWCEYHSVLRPKQRIIHLIFSIYPEWTARQCLPRKSPVRPQLRRLQNGLRRQRHF